MMQTIEKITGLESLGKCGSRRVSILSKAGDAREDLSLPAAYLKWYTIYPADIDSQFLPLFTEKLNNSCIGKRNLQQFRQSFAKRSRTFIAKHMCDLM